MKNQVRMRALGAEAAEEFEQVYPQTFCAVWRVEPYAVLGGSLPVSAGTIADWTSKKGAINALIKSMLSRENTEKTTEGVTDKFYTICVEGVFVLLLRRLLLKQITKYQQETRVFDRTIESIYRFRDGTWRHIWGERFFWEHEL